MSAPQNVAAIALSYLVGSIPWGLLLVRVFVGVDVRSVGSGNIGATNSARAGGKKLGIAVFVLDFVKGWAAVALVSRIGDGSPFLPAGCAMAAVLGHCFPIWLRFRGGKGVATMCGAVVGLDPILFVIGGAAWLVIASLTRFVGLASILMCVAFAIAAWWWGDAAAIGLTVLALLIIVRHRSNIGRMLAGTEPKLFERRASDG